VNVPTDAGAAGCAIWGSRWPGAPRGGPPAVAAECAAATEAGGDPSTQPDARRLCLFGVCFIFGSRVDVDFGTGWAKIASSLSDGSESSAGLRDPSAWQVREASFALDVACSVSSARRIQPSLPFWKSCFTVALLSPARRFLTGVLGLPFPRIVDVFVRPLGTAAQRNLSMISRVRECCLTRRSEDVTRKSGISASSDGVDSDTTSTS
jgi:hypothetical protein